LWAGYTGTAEPAEPLNEESEGEVPLSSKPIEKATSALHEHTVAAPKLSDENLGWTAKLIILAVIVGVCFAYVKVHTPRRTGPAGRHGAYEKGALP